MKEFSRGFYHSYQVKLGLKVSKSLAIVHLMGIHQHIKGTTNCSLYKEESEQGSEPEQMCKSQLLQMLCPCSHINRRLFDSSDRSHHWISSF